MSHAVSLSTLQSQSNASSVSVGVFKSSPLANQLADGQQNSSAQSAQPSPWSLSSASLSELRHKLMKHSASSEGALSKDDSTERQRTLRKSRSILSRSLSRSRSGFFSFSRKSDSVENIHLEDDGPRIINNRSVSALSTRSSPTTSMSLRHRWRTRLDATPSGVVGSPSASESGLRRRDSILNVRRFFSASSSHQHFNQEPKQLTVKPKSLRNGLLIRPKISPLKTLARKESLQSRPAIKDGGGELSAGAATIS